MRGKVEERGAGRERAVVRAGSHPPEDEAEEVQYATVRFETYVLLDPSLLSCAGRDRRRKPKSLRPP